MRLRQRVHEITGGPYFATDDKRWRAGRFGSGYLLLGQDGDSGTFEKLRDCQAYVDNDYHRRAELVGLARIFIRVHRRYLLDKWESQPLIEQDYSDSLMELLAEATDAEFSGGVGSDE